jgi:hypothetical protein
MTPDQWAQPVCRALVTEALNRRRGSNRRANIGCGIALAHTQVVAKPGVTTLMDSQGCCHMQAGIDADAQIFGNTR